MRLTLRAATNRDREAIEALVFGVLTEYGLKLDPEATDSDLQNIELNYELRGGMFSVLVDEIGQVVGSVGLFVVSPSVCELRKMYLAASARGLGYGRQMLEYALACARELGFTRMVLETASVLREAVALYERYGFRRYAPTHGGPLRCGVFPGPVPNAIPLAGGQMKLERFHAGDDKP